MKRFIFSILLLFSIVGYPVAQELPKITFTTAKAVGEKIQISVHADGVDRPNIWIDLNNNGMRDEGEEVQKFDMWRDANTPWYEVGAETITIHGNVKQFGAEGGKITSVDFSKSFPRMIRIWLANNLLETVDLSNQTGEVQFNIIRLSTNRLKGKLDFSHIGIRELYVERNHIESLSIRPLRQMTRLNVSRNCLTEESISNLLDQLETRVNYSSGNFYVVDTRDIYPEYPEGNQLRQYHLDHQNLKKPGHEGLNWYSYDVNPGVGIFHDISKIANSYRVSFTTKKSVGDKIKVNIDAEELFRNGVWIDLNGNGTKDAGEEVTTFGTDATYTINSQVITIYGSISKIDVSNNELTKFDSSTNPFLSYINLFNNNITEVKILPNQPIEEIDISKNNLSEEQIDKVIDILKDRTGLPKGQLVIVDLKGEEGNSVTGNHILKANTKNWDVLDTNGRILLATDVSDVFKWMQAPAIGLVGNMAIIAGPEGEVEQFTKFYINGEPVPMKDSRVDISAYSGRLEMKATSEDGLLIIRLVVNR